MRGSSLKSLLIAAAALGMVQPVTTSAQIAVGATGAGPLTFDTTPPDTEFTTGVLNGTAATFNTPADIDAAVAAVDQANIVRPLPTSGTIPPSTFSGGMRHNTTGLFLQSRPTTDGTNAAGMMLGKFRNTSGAPLTAFNLGYDFALFSAVTEDIPGFEVYFSDSGAPASWVKVTGLSDTITVGPQTATITPAVAIADGAPFYILWVDDNSDGESDESYTIDNLTVLPPGQVPNVTVDPAPSTTVNERGTVTLSIVAAGATSYQWYKGGTPLANGTSCVDGHDNTIAGALSSTLTITGVTPADAGMYRCEAINSAGSDVSADGSVTVTPDTVAPTVLYALCGSNPNEFIVVLSEPLNDSCAPIGGGGAVTDISNWSVEDIGGAGLGVVNYTNLLALQNGQRVIGLITGVAHDPTKSVRITWTADFVDQAAVPNTLPAGSIIALCYTNELLGFSAAWQYNDQDVDPGPTWINVGFADNAPPWATGTGPFDAKRDAGILHPNGLDDCRATALHNLGPVGTCINLQSPVTLTNLITAYFRTHFTFSGTPSSSTVLVLEGKADDGMAVYLNGTEIWRIGLAVGATHTTLGGRTGTGAGAVGDGDAQDVLILAGAASLVSGDNVLAVEAHQQAITSSDLTMGLKVSQLSSTPPLRVSISYDQIGGTVTVSWGGGTSAGTLRSATSITTPRPWPAVGGNPTSPYTTQNTGTQVFYEVSDP